jgi:glycosyltransferase involved in cell wall biosynthesis
LGKRNPEMRVAIIGPSKPIGGIGTHTRQLLRGLKSLGLNVEFVPMRVGINATGTLHYLSLLAKYYDVIHVQGLQQLHPLMAALAAREMIGGRVVATAHGFGGESSWWRSEIQRSLMRVILKNLDAIITVSDFVNHRLSRFSSLSYPKLVTIHNGIDTSFFSPQVDGTSVRATHAVNNGLLILYVGRLAWNKGIPDLLRAMPQILEHLKRAKLLICGRGKLEGVLRQQAKILGLGSSVFFTGIIPPDELPSYYAASDLVVVPSIFEPFGLVPVEAMSMAKPIVACRVGGIPETVVPGETGLLVPPHDPQAIADAVTLLAQDENLRVEMGRKGRRRVESFFSLGIMCEKTMKLYQHII